MQPIYANRKSQPARSTQKMLLLYRAPTANKAVRLKAPFSTSQMIPITTENSSSGVLRSGQQEQQAQQQQHGQKSRLPPIALQSQKATHAAYQVKEPPIAFHNKTRHHNLPCINSPDNQHLTDSPFPPNSPS